MKICGSQANLQHFHDGFDLEDGLFCKRIIVMELISDEFGPLHTVVEAC
jgi:hypothetical protein